MLVIFYICSLYDPRWDKGKTIVMIPFDPVTYHDNVVVISYHHELLEVYCWTYASPPLKNAMMKGLEPLSSTDYLRLKQCYAVH